MKPQKLILLIILAGFSRLVDAQTPPPPFQLGTIEVKREPLPGSTKAWIKLIANYSTTAKWMDGLAFNYVAIVQPTEEAEHSLRLLTGSVSYINVPAGKHQALLYLSPGAVARFGEPIAIQVDCFKGDEQLGSSIWTSSRGTKDDLKRTDIRRFDGFLLGVRSTPWLLIDNDKTPDIFAPY